MDLTLDHISLDFKAREIEETRETVIPALEVFNRNASDSWYPHVETDIFDFRATTFGIA